MFKSPSDLVEFLRQNVKPGMFTTYFNESLRCDGMCPICWSGYVAGVNPERRILDAVTIGHRLGFSDAQIQEIMTAADHNDIDNPLRTQLLDACGVITGGR